MNNLTSDIAYLRILIQKYFDGLTTPAEQHLLVNIATCPDIPSDITPDIPSDISENLKIIAAIENFGIDCLKNAASTAPTSLEERLLSHISNLAANDNPANIAANSFIKFLISIAAAIALILPFGINMLFTQDSNISEGLAINSASHTSGYKSHTSVNEADASTDEADHTPSLSAAATSSLTLRQEAITPRQQTAISRRHSPKPHLSSSSKASHVKPSNIYQVKTKPESPTDIRLSPDKINIPDFAETITEVGPILAQASVNPSQLALQPLSTLSQAIDNVYESISIVSKALAGADDTLETLSTSISTNISSSISSGFSSLQNLPLRSI